MLDRRRIALKRNIAPEPAASPGLTLQPDCPSHELDELFRDGEAEPRSAIAAIDRRIGLGEFVEQANALLRSDADPRVDHLDADDVALAGVTDNPRLDEDFAVLGELYRVVERIMQEPFEPRR